jgi:hypothetical protein
LASLLLEAGVDFPASFQMVCGGSPAVNVASFGVATLASVLQRRIRLHSEFHFPNMASFGGVETMASRRSASVCHSLHMVSQGFF